MTKNNKTGNVVRFDPLMRARDGRRSSKAPGAASMRPKPSRPKNTKPKQTSVTFTAGELLERQSTSEGRTVAFVASLSLMMDAIEAAKLLTTDQYRRLMTELGRVVEPGFLPEDERLARMALDIVTTPRLGAATIVVAPEPSV